MAVTTTIVMMYVVAKANRWGMQSDLELEQSSQHRQKVGERQMPRERCSGATGTARTRRGGERKEEGILLLVLHCNMYFVQKF